LSRNGIIDISDDTDGSQLSLLQNGDHTRQFLRNHFSYDHNDARLKDVDVDVAHYENILKKVN
jgi:hypothetical protein